MPIDMPPNPGFIARSSFGLVPNTQVWASPLTRATQRVELGGARWEASYTIRRMRASEPGAGQWMAFFLRLNGMVESFHAYDPDRKAPRGAITGTPQVAGAGQTGKTLLIDGCPPDTVVFLPGDMINIGVGGELKMVTLPALSNGSGEATITFAPATRNSPADNAPIVYDKPTVPMILTDDRQAIWECGPTGIYEEKTFSAFEVF